MAYKSITATDLVTAVEQMRYMPKMMEHISGIAENPMYDNVFSKDRKIEKTARYFDINSTRTIEIVTYGTVAGKWVPIGSRVIEAGRFEPKEIKLVKTYSATDLDEMGRVMMKSSAELFTEDFNDFILTREEMIKNQCNQLFASGSITYPVRTEDGNIVTADTINYTTYFGTISALTTGDSRVVDWSSASTTQDEIWNSIISLIKYGRTQTDLKHFMNVRDVVIFAEDTAFNYLAGIAPMDYTEKYITRDGFDYVIGRGASTIRIINSNLPYYTWTYDSTTDHKWEKTSANALSTKQILILDNSKGNFKLRDMKYLTTKNATKDVPQPYFIKTKEADDESSVSIMFGTKPLVIGNTKAYFKVTIAA
jgi:hypothetical protein